MVWTADIGSGGSNLDYTLGFNPWQTPPTTATQPKTTTPTSPQAFGEARFRNGPQGDGYYETDILGRILPGGAFTPTKVAATGPSTPPLVKVTAPDGSTYLDYAQPGLQTGYADSSNQFQTVYGPDGTPQYQYDSQGRAYAFPGASGGGDGTQVVNLGGGRQILIDSTTGEIIQQYGGGGSSSGGGGISGADQMRLQELSIQARDLEAAAQRAFQAGESALGRQFQGQQAELNREITRLDQQIQQQQFNANYGLNQQKFGLDQELGWGNLRLNASNTLNQLIQSPVDGQSILEFINAGGGNINNAIASGASALNAENMQPAAQALEVAQGLGSSGGGGFGGVGGAVNQLPILSTSPSVVNGDSLVNSATSSGNYSSGIGDFLRLNQPQAITPVTPAPTGPSNMGPLGPSQLQDILAQRDYDIAQRDATFAAPWIGGRGVPPPPPPPQGIGTLPDQSPTPEVTSTLTKAPGADIFAPTQQVAPPSYPTVQTPFVNPTAGAMGTEDFGPIPGFANGGVADIGRFFMTGEGASGKGKDRELAYDLPDPGGVRVFNPEETRQLEQMMQAPRFAAGGIFQPAGQAAVDAVTKLRQGAFVPQDFSFQQADFFNRFPTFQDAARKGIATRTGISEQDVQHDLEKFRLRGYGRGNLAIGA